MDIAALRTYVHIVEEGSFAAAARRMGISKSMSSKYISDLEASLGVRLLTRSTRSVKPTVLGQEYYEKLKEVLETLSEANEIVRSAAAVAMGRLKITAPVSYSFKVLQPAILEFVEEYPEIQLEYMINDQCVDLVSEGFDAAIRIGDLEDSSMYVRRLASSKVHVVASPDYVKENGAPETPGDLLVHRCLYYTNLRSSGTWPFQQADTITYQKVKPVFSSNNGDIISMTAVAGKGVAFLPDFLVESELKAETLVPLLTDYSLPEMPVSVVYPSRKHVSASLKAFLDFITGFYSR